MKYEVQYAGKWVATRDDEVVAYAKTLRELREKLSVRKEVFELKYTLVPKGFMAG